LILAPLVLITLSSGFLFAYGCNLVYLSLRALRLPPVAEPPALTSDEPLVAVQLPVYNERYVARRLIDATARLDWPRDRLEIQVLDDSDDETVGIVAERVAHWRGRGLRVSHLRRTSRDGYKAGALAHGLELTGAPLIAIFDADFLPGPDFLRRAVGAFADPRTGFVQARWGHLNREYSLFTRLQSLMVDFHFRVEQAVRPAAGYLTNFTGTAGVWRRNAIEDAGGWSATTLTEDLDLSYRAQLRGWKARFLEGLEVRQELPVAVNAYRGQQSRWATGSFQTALKLLPSVLRSRCSAAEKFQAVMHLLAYLAPALMLLQLACYPLLLLAKAEHSPYFGLIRVPVLVNLLSLAPSIGFSIAQWRAGPGWWRRIPGILAWSFVGAGTSATVVAGLIRALRPGGVFKRTPKFRIEGQSGEWRDHAYVQAGDPAALAELLLGTGGLILCGYALALDEWLIAFYSLLFSLGFLYLSIYSVVQAIEVLTVRRLGLQALAGLRSALPLVGLLAAPAALLFALAQWPDPFEDSFQHWLLAANLLTTGHLVDPLFGMQDTWLPGYSFLAAAVLRLAGWHDLAALKLANAAIALVTLGLLTQLAPTRRQGRLAILLLALNPIFLLTATSAVAEPLLLLAITAASAAALARRHALAASWAILACLTGTKAWLWIFCALAVMGATALAERGGRRAPQRLAWAVPAVAVLALFQVGAGEASHSVARAAQEVGSAVARGDLNPDPGGRALAFAGYFLLASLPLAVLAPLGLRAYLRPENVHRLRLLVLPGLLYLGVVTLLVAAGIYSGSHRYYYLALPGLALLAGAGLDRHPRLLGAGAAVAAGLVAVAFLPVLAGFSAIDRGLAEAGRVAGTQPGSLLTDSPVAAYYSGKPPSQVYGSQALPSDPAVATGWLHDRMGSTVISEDIDYYRLTTVFPGLADGSRPPPPFRPLGDQAAYNVAGGKPAHVYSLPPEQFCTWVTDGAQVDLSPTEQPGRGKTAGLQKGLVLESPSGNLAGEGMGFGAPLVRYPDGDYFSGTATTVDVSSPGHLAWVKSFQLDRLGVDEDRSFKAVPSRGRVDVTYRVEAGRIDVRVVATELAPGFQQFVIFNEQSSRFDDFADSSRTLLGDRIGSWTPVAGAWGRFRSGASDLEWSLGRPAGVQGMYAARELRSPDLDFSGLDYVFGPDFTAASYQVTVGKAR
jgi:cellulose synthase/poly-beta-1,6-N-acetylglucosamine synthase-like glycosyltransferase